MSSREIIFSAAGAGAPPTYIEDVFSTWLYTGTSANQTITNGIDLAGKGGLVWIKQRQGGSTLHGLFDTNRGVNNYLASNDSIAQNGYGTFTDLLTAFNSNGFSLGADSTPYGVNWSPYPTASWTFRKQPKFFDVVTYTGTGSNTLQVSHSLGSTPGMVIYKRTDSTSDWCCLNRANNGGYEGMYLNKTDSSLGNSGSAAGAGLFSTYVKPGEYWGSFANTNGATYVAYLFAHDAGGFGTAGTDNVISCGSYTGNGSNTGPTITLGYEPQYVLIKSATSAQGWWIFDSMRGGLSLVGYTALTANTSNAEVASSLVQLVGANATGFQLTNSTPVTNASGQTYIYMAIRRGPMKTPTSGTSVFNVVARNGTGTTASVTSGFPVDLIIGRKLRSLAYTGVVDRLRGFAPQLSTQQTVAEVNDTTSVTAMGNTTVTFGDDSFNWGAFNQAYSSPASYAPWMFGRAPGFFDIVCYTGTGTNRTVTHNLGAVPELMIVKRRNTSGTSWFTYSSATGNTNALLLDTTDAAFNVGATGWNSTTPTSSVFSLGTSVGVNQSASTYVAYLFATLAGVSKVGSYTGNGSSQTINAGLPTGARFVLIKRTDDVGDWWVWDTARGMVAGTDPRVTLNLTDAQINNDWVYTVTNGFQIVTTDATVNASGGSYIYLAIA